MKIQVHLKSHRLLLAFLGTLVCANIVFTQDLTTTRTAISGIWWSPDMEQSAAFLIKDSTIYYPDFFAEFRYELKGDSLLIFREDGIAGSRIVRVTPDTLILSSWGREHIYTRAEPRKPD